MARQLNKIQVALETAKAKELTLSQQLSQLEQMLNQEKQRLSILQHYQYESQHYSTALSVTHSQPSITNAKPDVFLATLHKNIKRQTLRISELEEAYSRQHKIWQQYNSKIQSLTLLLTRLQETQNYSEN